MACSLGAKRHDEGDGDTIGGESVVDGVSNVVKQVGDGALASGCVLEGKAEVGQDCEAAVLDLLGLHTATGIGTKGWRFWVRQIALQCLSSMQISGPRDGQ